MLEALEQGVKGGVWFSLMDKVYSLKNLRAAWGQVERNHGAAGVDRQSVDAFGSRAEEFLQALHEELKSDRYRPQPVRRRWIPKPGGTTLRPLGIPAVRDRVVQTALRNVLEPIWERRFAPQSYGFRPGRGCKDALRRVEELLAAGCTWVVDADIQQYFDTLDHDRLLSEVRREVADGAILKLIRQYLTQGVAEDSATWTPEEGTPQGAVISPLLANIYLHPVDQALAAAGHEVVRYADDLVILCRSQEEAAAALERLRGELAARGLTLHPEKTRRVDATQPGGFDFLGYHFERGLKWPRKKSLDRLKNAVRERTRRTRGDSLRRIIADLNPVLRGWFEYFKHSHHRTFPRLDGWIRMRLRSILRKQQGKAGRGRGADHQRWPIAHFTAHGLFTMTEARAAALRSR
jgi:RNA-directed DNA polymerase